MHSGVCTRARGCGWEGSFPLDVLELGRHGDESRPSPAWEPSCGRACVRSARRPSAQAPCGSGTDLTWPSQALYLLAKLRNVTSLSENGNQVRRSSPACGISGGMSQHILNGQNGMWNVPERMGRNEGHSLSAANSPVPRPRSQQQ